FSDPAIHSKLGQDRHHLSHRDSGKVAALPSEASPFLYRSTASRILPRVTMSRTALERSLLCSLVSSFKKSKFSRSIRILIVFVIWLSPVSARHLLLFRYRGCEGSRRTRTRELLLRSCERFGRGAV